ncbi:Myb/SANT-like domain-containing protein [Dioscorea alata]|uniref:Myb/SANT-like domain-containing protein n=1 Tax=Dioscorea alata TaxID=55571 RepID=A0ACB7V1S7_DIOAL|nr:Myb/SANT-like domain-containing protein [Dioscorea alata]
MASKLPPKRIVQGTNVGDVNLVASENTPKARWDDTNIEIFLKTCVEKVQIGNRLYTHFTKEGWKNVISKFAARKGKEFGIWAKLVEHQTGLGWDPVKRTVIASDDWWEKKRQWRQAGYMALVPYAEPSSENEVSNDNAYAWMNDVDIEVDNFEDDGSSPQENNNATPGETSISQSRKRQRPSQKEKKKSAKEKLQESFDRLLSWMDNMSRTSNIRVENDYRCSITKCVDLLDTVQGMEQGSPHYFLMVRLFAKKYHRETFVALVEKDLSLAISWCHTFTMDDLT